VQERLGHSSIRLTMDTYSHLMPGMQREAVRRSLRCWLPPALPQRERRDVVTHYIPSKIWLPELDSNQRPAEYSEARTITVGWREVGWLGSSC
jgi:hypothetical protein